MLTRCPGCQTVFRLTSEQLLARQGRVRCGSCLHPFNALDHLAESDPKAGQQPSRQRPKTPTPTPTPTPPKPPVAPRPAVTASSHSAATVIPGARAGTPSIQPDPIAETSSKTRPVLAPVIKKTSQRSLSDLDFSSSIDTQSRVPRPAQQWTSSQNFPLLEQSFTDTLIPAAPTQAPFATPAELPPQASPLLKAPTQKPLTRTSPPAPTPEPKPTPKAPPSAPTPELKFTPKAPPPAPTPEPKPTLKAPPPAPTPELKFTPKAPPPAPVPEAKFSPKAPPSVPTPEAKPSPEQPALTSEPKPLPEVPPPAPKVEAKPLPEAPPPAPEASPPPSLEALTIVLFDPLNDVEVTPKSPPKAATPALEAEPSPSPEVPLPSQDKPLPQITRSRENQERKRDKSREKSREKSRKRKRTEPGKPSRFASTFMSIGKALEERTGWGKRRKKHTEAVQKAEQVVDDDVLSDIFSKYGIETKIDKIEAEFDAEAKAARAEARSKITAPKPSTPAEDLPSVFDVAYGTPTTHIQQHRLWTTAVNVLGILLVIQAVFLFRNHIARTFPSTRPALVSLCNTLGCAMPLPHDESQIEIVDYGFARLNERSDRYVLYVKVTNNAKFAQDWPNLELILKNDIHQPLSRRILVPAEWVPPERFAQNNGIPPRGNVDINMELEVTGITPSKFEVGHFYP